MSSILQPLSLLKWNFQSSPVTSCQFYMMWAPNKAFLKCASRVTSTLHRLTFPFLIKINKFIYYVIEVVRLQSHPLLYYVLRFLANSFFFFFSSVIVNTLNIIQKVLKLLYYHLKKKNLKIDATRMLLVLL